MLGVFFYILNSHQWLKLRMILVSVHKKQSAADTFCTMSSSSIIYRVLKVGPAFYLITIGKVRKDKNYEDIETHV
jgi:hypothetical protein